MTKTRCLLDTNILVHFVRKNDIWKRIRKKYSLLLGDPIPLYSVVTEGEIRSLALRFRWGWKNQDSMEYALKHFKRVGLNETSLIKAYAAIDYACRTRGIVLSKNDLWIGATAHFTRCRLLSTDKDFQPLAGEFFDFEWVDPARAA